MVKPEGTCSDFNSTEDSETYKILVHAGENRLNMLKDTFYETFGHQKAAEITFHGFGDEAEKRIDYIFIKNEVAVLNYSVFNDMPEGRHASDHFPVAADVVIGACAPK